MPEYSVLDARLAEIDRRLRTIQTGLEPAAQPAAEPVISRTPAAAPGPSPALAVATPAPAIAPPAPGADPSVLIDQLRELVAGQERWLAAARELLATHDHTPAAPIGVSAGPFASIEALRRFERSLASLPEVREVVLREYVGDDRAVVDVHLQPIS